MNELQAYFQNEYLLDKNRVREVDYAVNDVLKTLSICDPHNGWPYSIENAKPVENKNFSFSTTSMIYYVVAKTLNKISDNSPLAPSINWELDIEDGTLKIKLEGLLTQISELLIERFKKNITKNYRFSSKTFGIDDPLTFSWYAEFLSSHKNDDAGIKKDFRDCAKKIVEDLFANPKEYKLKWKNENTNNELKSTSINHIFPIIRVVHLFKSIKENFNDEIDNIESESKLISNLLERIYKQLSLHQVSSNMFDTAELVMPLEGLLLLDDDLKKTNKQLIRKIFEVISENQKSNLYWRPLQPFVTNERGFILLPLSIEVANSLLRICKYLQKNNHLFFYDYFDIFHKYTEWLYSRKVVCKPLGVDEVMGWHSEHVSNENVIHPWETAQAIIYLLNYKSLLNDQISHNLFSKSYLSVKVDFIKKDGRIRSNYWKNEWEKNEPLINLREPNSPYKIYERIRKYFIEPFETESSSERNYSMLLYGPPGTGKSTIAEELAKSLNWKLITITPSDFIHSGVSNIEANAKSIFKVLEEQKECVVLFDELDRMIFDRDHPEYGKQAEMFQFLTPSMLVKIKDLRSRKRNIFIIATNYEEKIDSAIKRVGRIDYKFLVNLPDIKQRQNIIIDVIKDIYNITIEDHKTSELKEIIRQTVLYNYGELYILIKSLGETGLNSNNVICHLKNALKMHPGSIVRLESYESRFDKGLKSHQMPIEEFLLLVYLKQESDKIKENDEEVIRNIKSILGSHFSLDEHIKDKNIIDSIKPIWNGNIVKS